LIGAGDDARLQLICNSLGSSIPHPDLRMEAL
jgi:hypothetical protein